MKQTLQQGNYKYIKYLGNGEHLLIDLNTYVYEVWFANKNTASYALIWRNTHLEFARSMFPTNSLEHAILTTNRESIRKAKTHEELHDRLETLGL